METTNNTGGTSKMNLSEIMTSAHSITRNTLNRSNEQISYSATFGAALSVAWSTAKYQALNAPIVASADDVEEAMEALLGDDGYAKIWHGANVTRVYSKRYASSFGGYYVEISDDGECDFAAYKSSNLEQLKTALRAA